MSISCGFDWVILYAAKLILFKEVHCKLIFIYAMQYLHCMNVRDNDEYKR